MMPSNCGIPNCIECSELQRYLEGNGLNDLQDSIDSFQANRRQLKDTEEANRGMNEAASRMFGTVQAKDWDLHPPRFSSVRSEDIFPEVDNTLLSKEIEHLQHVKEDLLKLIKNNDILGVELSRSVYALTNAVSRLKSLL